MIAVLDIGNIMNANLDADEVCASCGIKGGDRIKLKRCTACKLIQYCSVACQKGHRSQHKQACKRRAAELHDKLLFKQPKISHLGECPLCCLPLELETSKSKLHPCCSKLICDGCVFAHQMREVEESQENKCPFCRTLCPKNQTESMNYVMKRIQANDPVAIQGMALDHYHKQNFSRAFEGLSKAAELGDIESHFKLANLYMREEGVEKVEKKITLHLEVAAIAGHPIARYYLGISEGKAGRMERSVKHLIIAANLGHDDSLDILKSGYRAGLVKKEDFAAVLRTHKSAVDATKSPQREAAEAETKVARW